MLQNQNLIIEKILVIIISSLILCSMAVYNGFPFVFNTDTAMYLEAASRHRVGPDRPIIYGLFMNMASLGISLWIVVITQSLIISILLFYYFKHFISTENEHPIETKLKILYFLIFVTVVSFFMGAGFTSSWLMPDIFTPVAILGIGLLLFANQLSRTDILMISVFTILGLGMHNSNPYISLIMCTIILVAALSKSVRKVYNTAKLRIRRIWYVILLIVISQVLVSSVHYSYGGGFKSSRGGIFFLMGSLVEMGVIKTYLNENCQSKHYFICNYKDSLPSNFLWNTRSPINLNGGWAGNEKEYSLIIKDILTTPRYLTMVIKGSISVSVKQFFRYGTGEAHKPWNRVNTAIADNFIQDYSMYERSRQSKGKLNFDIINFSQTIIFSVCILWYIFVLIYKKADHRFRLFIVFIFLSIVVNAWFCSTFSGVFHRYQTRIIWLLPLPIFIYYLANSLKKLSIDPLKSW